jgi:hypothetical protein
MKQANDMAQRERRRLAITSREAVDVLKRLDPTFAAVCRDSPRKSRAVEQRVRRLEKRGVMTPVRRGAGPLDPYLFDELAVVSAVLYIRLLRAGVRMSTAAGFVEFDQPRLREAIETGADLVAWIDPALRVSGVMLAGAVDRVLPRKRLPRIVRVRLRPLVVGVRDAIAQIRMKHPAVWAGGKPVPVDTLLRGAPSGSEGR